MPKREGWVETDDHGNVTIHAPAAGTASSYSAPVAYLDTNLVSALARRDIPDDEVNALFALVELMHADRIRFVTSTVTQEEIEGVPPEHRAPHQGIYALLAKTPAVEEQVPFVPVITNRGGSRLVGPPVVKDGQLGALETILPDLNDARHIFQAIKNGTDYFVTADNRTILSRAKEIEAAFPIRVVSPSQLVAILEATPTS